LKISQNRGVYKMLEGKVLENVVKISKLLEDSARGDMFFAYTGVSLDDTMFNTISICRNGAFLVHDE
jgi:hypothetical protein